MTEPNGILAGMLAALEHHGSPPETRPEATTTGLLVAIFVLESWIKAKGYDAALGYMQRFGVPGLLLPPALLVESLGSILIVLGWQTRVAALGLSAFCVATAVLFHADTTSVSEQLHFWKDLSMAGGFLVLSARGPGAWSLDTRRTGGAIG